MSKPHLSAPSNSVYRDTCCIVFCSLFHFYTLMVLTVSNKIDFKGLCHTPCMSGYSDLYQNPMGCLPPTTISYWLMQSNISSRETIMTKDKGDFISLDEIGTKTNIKDFSKSLADLLFIKMTIKIWVFVWWISHYLCLGKGKWMTYKGGGTFISITKRYLIFSPSWRVFHHPEGSSNLVDLILIQFCLFYKGYNMCFYWLGWRIYNLQGKP